MFTKLGWEWEYEPIDLNGYISDFIIKFPHKHLLVEVKGDTDIKNIEQYADKIVKSGWDGEFLLVCSVLNDDEGIYLGLLGSTKYKYSWKDIPYENGEEPNCPTVRNGDYAYLTTCDECKSYTIYNNNDGWFCRNCGSGCSNKSLTNNRVKKEIKELIIKCLYCKKYDEDIEKYRECVRNALLWEKNKNDRLLCNCDKYKKLFYKCRKCNIYPYIDNPMTMRSDCCSCEYEIKCSKITQFWIDAKNHSQWKGK
jgi:hypothetical protein